MGVVAGRRQRLDHPVGAQAEAEHEDRRQQDQRRAPVALGQPAEPVADQRSIAARLSGARAPSRAASKTVGNPITRRSTPTCAASPLIAFCALLCAQSPSRFAPGASAKTPARRPARATSPNVVGGSVNGKLTSSNVDPVQAQLRDLRPGEEGDEAGYRTAASRSRRPVAQLLLPADRQLRPNPNVVSYICTFRGADTRDLHQAHLRGHLQGLTTRGALPRQARRRRPRQRRRRRGRRPAGSSPAPAAARRRAGR